MSQYLCRLCKNMFLQSLDIKDDSIPKELSHVRFGFVCYNYKYLVYGENREPGCSAFIPMDNTYDCAWNSELDNSVKNALSKLK